MSSSSTWRRPAVSRITTSSPSLRAASRPSRAAATGSLRSSAIHRQLDLLAELLELIDRRGALEVAGDERGALPVTAQKEAELRRGGRLARPLETGEEDHRRRAAEREPRVPRTHERGQLLVDDLHDLLTRREALQDVLSQRPLLDGRREVARNFEVDVRLEEREADLAHRLRDRLLVEATTATEAAESGLELVGERVEHGRKVYAEASRGQPLQIRRGRGRRAAPGAALRLPPSVCRARAATWRAIPSGRASGRPVRRLRRPSRGRATSSPCSSRSHRMSARLRRPTVLVPASSSGR